MSAILKQCEDIQPELMQMWEQLVNLDSGSGYSKGLKQVGAIIGSFLERQGMLVAYYPASQSDGEFNLCATVEGTGEKSILLLAHMDTVFAEGTAKNRPFRLDNEWAYGPGVSDCKGGIVLALYAVAILKKLEIAPYNRLTLLFNCDEEISSPSSRDLIVNLAKQHDYVLSLEPGGQNDSVISWRKGTAKLHLEVYGKASHSGSDPDKGCNALIELTYQLTRLANLGCRKRQTTVTFTKANSGERLNVVPDYAEAWADVRITSVEELDRIESEANCLASNPIISGTKTKVTLLRQKPPFAPNSGTDDLIKKAQAIYAEIGRTLSSNGAGGASDANWAAMAGNAIILDSLGPVKGGANHTIDEKTRIDSVIPRLYLLLRLIMELGNGSRG